MTPLERCQERLDYFAEPRKDRKTESIPGVLCKAYVYIDISSGLPVIMRADGKESVALPAEMLQYILKLGVD